MTESSVFLTVLVLIFPRIQAREAKNLPEDRCLRIARIEAGGIQSAYPQNLLEVVPERLSAEQVVKELDIKVTERAVPLEKELVHLNESGMIGVIGVSRVTLEGTGSDVLG